METVLAPETRTFQVVSCECVLVVCHILVTRNLYVVFSKRESFQKSIQKLSQKLFKSSVWSRKKLFKCYHKVITKLSRWLAFSQLDVFIDNSYISISMTYLVCTKCFVWTTLFLTHNEEWANNLQILVTNEFTKHSGTRNYSNKCKCSEPACYCHGINNTTSELLNLHFTMSLSPLVQSFKSSIVSLQL